MTVAGAPIRSASQPCSSAPNGYEPVSAIM